MRLLPPAALAFALCTPAVFARHSGPASLASHVIIPRMSAHEDGAPQSTEPVIAAPSLPFAPLSSEEKYAADSAMEGPDSPYTALMQKMLRDWPPATAGFCARDFAVPCARLFETPGSPLYVGVESTVWIHAGLEAVEKSVDDINAYAQIFPGYRDVHIISRDANKVLTSWEARVPVPFIPNIRYEMTYIATRPRPGLRAWLYKMRSSNKVRYSDGLIVAEQIEPGVTRYTEYDFFDINWGILRWFARDQIWRGGLETVVLSSLAIKYRAEEPASKPGEVRAAAEKALRRPDLEVAFKSRAPFQRDARYSARR